MTCLRPGAIIPAVYSEHLAGAGFTWARRKRVATSSQHRFVDLLEADERLAAHVSGLLLGGEEGLALAESAPSDPEELWTVLVAASAQSSPEAAALVVERHARTADALDWVRGALSWLPGEKRRALTQALSRLEGHAVAQAVCVGEAASSGEWSATAIAAAMRSEHAPVRATAQDALARLGAREHVAFTTAGLDDAELSVRYAAARANVLLGRREGLEVLRAVAEESTPHPRARAAADLWGRRAPLPEVLTWAAERRQRSPLAALRAAAALGAAGSIEAGDLLLEFLPDVLGRKMAAEALAIAGGIDLQDELVVDEAATSEAQTEDNSDDEDLIALEHPTWFELPAPEPSWLAERWKQLRGGWSEQARHLAGQPVSEGALEQLLRSGTQAQRAAAAIETCLRSGTPAPLFDVEAPARGQHALLQRAPWGERRV